jgi:phosphoethanolamine N-methyltransferase
MSLSLLRNPFARARQAARRLLPGAPAAVPPSVAAPASIAPTLRSAALPEPAVRWTQARVGVADALWGEGFVIPGGEEEVLRLAVPLGLSEASSLLLLGAAGGGAARAVVSKLGAWVSGHEADPALAALAAVRLARAGKVVARRASVVPWDPRAPVFRRRGFDHALALEALRGAPGRPVPVPELLLALAGALRPGGHLVLVDMVATGALDQNDPLVRHWAEVEGRTRQLPTEAALTAALAELRFDVRIAEDISARHMRLAVQGWKALVHGLVGAHPERAHAAAMVAEAEVWMRRLRLMHSGHVRLMRWDAIGR